MKILLSLIKTNLNISFGISALKYRFTKEKKRLWEPILIFASIILGLGSIIGLYYIILLGIFMGGKSLGQPEIVLTTAFMASQLIILFFGIFYIISSFYFSKDMNLLIPLPIKPSHIMASKFINILINEYMVAVPFLLPALIIYGSDLEVNIFYWLKGIILILTAPILPLVIAALFVIILMRFVNVRKSKDLLVILGSFVGILLGVGINLLVQQIPKGNEDKFFSNLIQSQEGIIKAIGSKFPPSIWATYGLTKSGFESFGYTILFIGVSIILFSILMWLGNQVFYKGLLSGQEVHRKTKTMSTEQLKVRSTKTSSPVIALFWREWKLFIRTPIYATNGLVGMFLPPFLMIMPLFTGENEMKIVIDQLKSPELKFAITLGTLAIGLLIASVNIIACTSISREGSTFWISKIVPVSPKDQILAKLIHSTVLSFLGVLLVIIIVQFIIGLSILRVLSLIILGAIGSIMLNIINLIIDVLRPKLEWNNPQEAVKQNMNALLGILLCLLFIALSGGIVAILMLVKSPEWLIFISLAIIMGVISIIGLYSLFALTERQYNRIEV